MTEATLTGLRAPFTAEQVGKLPRSTCRACSDSSRKRCDQHSWVSNCPQCKGSHSSATMHLDFVGHADVTDRLLQVDPEWTWEPFGTGPDGLPARDRDGNLWIRLTVLGVTRPGVGDGKNAKECIGDAIRNAAMRFGVALDLWAKGDRSWTSTADETPQGHERTVAQQREETRSDAEIARDDLRELCRRNGLDLLQVAQDFKDGHDGTELKDALDTEIRRFTAIVKAGIEARKAEHDALVKDTLATERPAERLQGPDPEDPWAQDNLPTPTEATAK